MLSILLSAALAAAPADGVRFFEGAYEAALAKAAAAKVPLFLDFFTEG